MFYSYILKYVTIPLGRRVTAGMKAILRMQTSDISAAPISFLKPCMIAWALVLLHSVLLLLITLLLLIISSSYLRCTSYRCYDVAAVDLNDHHAWSCEIKGHILLYALMPTLVIIITHVPCVYVQQDYGIPFLSLSLIIILSLVHHHLNLIAIQAHI